MRVKATITVEYEVRSSDYEDYLPEALLDSADDHQVAEAIRVADSAQDPATVVQYFGAPEMTLAVCDERGNVLAS